MHSHINIELARTLTLTAINKYLSGITGPGDRYGQYHGSMGISRARKMKSLLESSDVKSHTATVIGVLYAVFGEPNAGGFFGFQLGRSSRLASLIADELITGEEYHSAYHGNQNPLTSNVFSPAFLEQARSNDDNYRVVPNDQASYSYFDKTKAVRELLNQALSETKGLMPIIKDFAKKLKKFFETVSEEKISYSIFPRIEERVKARIDGATHGALHHTVVPDKGKSTIASFLAWDSGAILSTSNQTAYKTAKKTEQEQLLGIINVLENKR